MTAATRRTSRRFDSTQQECYLNLWRTYDRLRMLEDELFQRYELTPQQYNALVKLTAALCKIFPQIKPDYPRDASGKLITEKLPDEVLRNYKGVIGHYHIQANKTDPGPALQWDKVINGARRLLGLRPL